jgi:hypothetical protein
MLFPDWPRKLRLTKTRYAVTFHDQFLLSHFHNTILGFNSKEETLREFSTLGQIKGKGI